MLRIICEQVDEGAVAAGAPGAKVKVTYRTFDIDAPRLEAWLREHKARFVVGADVHDDNPEQDVE